MKKLKIYLFICLFAILNVLFIQNVNADYVCEYDGKAGYFKFTVYDQNSNGTNVSSVYLGSNDSTDEIANWKIPVKGTIFNGELYSQAGLCPDYIIHAKVDYHVGSILGCLFTDSINLHSCYGDFIFVSDTDNITAIKKEIKNQTKVSYLLFTVNTLNFMKISDLKAQPNKPKVEPIVETPKSCLEFPKTPIQGSAENSAKSYSCENNPYFACLWVENGQYCNSNKLQYIHCGNSFDIPNEVPALLSFVVNLLKIAVPIILVITSIITLLKAVAASTEDDIKKAQKTLIKKLIAGILIFFVVTIVQFVMLKVADSSEVGSLNDCLSCMLNNSCEDSLYYKVSENGINRCYYVNGGELSCFDNN